jgi:hypothetical protein
VETTTNERSRSRGRAVLVAVLLPIVMALLGIVPAGSAADPCGEGFRQMLGGGGEVLCTHGDDAETDPIVAAAAAGGTRTDGVLPSVPVACQTDGIDGHRVQVLYVHRKGAQDRRAALSSSIDRWIGQVAWTFEASAARRGGVRVVRFVTTRNGSGCRADVRSVSVAGDAIGDFSRTVQAIQAAGYNERGRTYLLLVDDDTYCGLATAPRDDRKVANNAAETQIGYARVDRRCWDTGDRGFHSIAAHELTHTLGAVQASAPGATAGGHCRTEWDLLCYADAAGVKLDIRCQDRNSRTSGAGDHNDRLLDCTGDTYFHPAPRSGSYLARHWNVADHTALLRGRASGAGHVGSNPVVARDPRGRTQTWSNDTLGGAHRPLLAAAHGFEACDVPVQVRVPREEAAGDVVGGLVDTVDRVANGPQPDPVLDAAVRDAVARINGAVGRTVLIYDGALVDGNRGDGVLDLTWASLSTLADARVQVRDVRIRSAEVLVDRGRVEAAGTTARRLFATHALAMGLGVGRVDVPTDVMARVPRSDASDTVALRALRHLYRSCDIDPRLSTVGRVAAADDLPSVDAVVSDTGAPTTGAVVVTEPEDAPDRVASPAPAADRAEDTGAAEAPVAPDAGPADPGAPGAVIGALRRDGDAVTSAEATSAQAPVDVRAAGTIVGDAVTARSPLFVGGAALWLLAALLWLAGARQPAAGRR